MKISRHLKIPNHVEERILRGSIIGRAVLMSSVARSGIGANPPRHGPRNASGCPFPMDSQTLAVTMGLMKSSRIVEVRNPAMGRNAKKRGDPK